MSGLLERKPTVEHTTDETSKIQIDDDRAGSVFDTLSVPTARAILAELYREPTAKSELADRVDSSLQNVSYHLENLEEAGLVEVVDQWYSEKGMTMDVYAPSVDAVVLLPEASGTDDPDSHSGKSAPESSGRPVSD